MLVSESLVAAQDTVACAFGDSLRLPAKAIEKRQYRFIDDVSFSGIPLVGAAMIIDKHKKEFRQNTSDDNPLRVKDRLVTSFDTRIDDYIQYSPIVFTTALKACGNPGRSDWGRYAATSLLSYGLMAGIVNSVKYSVKEMRPDGSSRNSFPSGHTATVFAGATILHKEYGLTTSPWYSIGGYAVATATGVMRVLNNRHWVSDVLAGAGIGIMSTELAYGITDLIFRQRGLRRTDLDDIADIRMHPSFFSLYMGVGIGNSDLTFDLDNTLIDTRMPFGFNASTVVGVECAYFFTKNFGVGVRLNMRSTPVSGFGDLMGDVKDFYKQASTQAFWREHFGQDLAGLTDTRKPVHDDYVVTIHSDHFTDFTPALGVYFQMPLSQRFAVGAKLMGARSVFNDVDLGIKVQGNKIDYDGLKGDFRVIDEKYTHEWDLLNIHANSTASLVSGVSMTYSYKSSFVWRVFVDYDYTCKTYKLTYDPMGFLPAAAGVKETVKFKAQPLRRHLNNFTIGGSFGIAF